MIMSHQIQKNKFYEAVVDGKKIAVKVDGLVGDTLFGCTTLSTHQTVYLKTKDFRKEISEQEFPEYFLWILTI